MSYVCDRSAAVVDGFGVLFGMVITGIDPATFQMRRWLFCYEDDCSTEALAVVLLTPGAAENQCSRCGDTYEYRSPDIAVLTTDIPAGQDEPRLLMFCRANGCAAALLAA